VGFAPIEGPLLATILYGTVGAALVLLASLLPAAFEASRKRAGWVEHAAYATSSVPGILLAFGVLHGILFLQRAAPMVVGGASLWTWLEGGSVFLLLGYVMRFLSQGYAALKPALLQVDRRWVDAARSLGAGTWRRVRHIWLPSMGSGLVAAYVLLFIAVSKELPVTLMLIPAGQQTLAYRVFDAQSEASLPDVGLAGLLLLGLALLVNRTLMRWSRHG
jgi:iron(III) transport system permease protein